jgi:multicomponent Na+:H+ antiporter subunit D
MAVMISAVSLLSLVAGIDDLFFDVAPKKVRTYFLLHNVVTAAMLALIFVNDLFTAYVFIELITIVSVALIASKPTGRTWTAALNYLFMSLIGSSLFTFAMAMLYGITGYLHFNYVHESLIALVGSGDYMVPLVVSAVMMIMGLAIKGALFPFHSWLPEAHGSATTPASSLLSGLIIKSYLLLMIKVIFRVYGIASLELMQVPRILLVCGVGAIIYGSYKAMRKRGLKRTLAYSSVSQVGYICIAIGLNTTLGIAAACFHIIAHAVAKSMLFSAAGALSAASGHRQDFDSLRGAFWRDPFAGTAFIIGGLAMIGIPPLAGFASKLNIIGAALQTPYSGIVIIAVVILGTVMGAMIYVPFIFAILARDEDDPTAHISPRAMISRVALVILMVLTGLLGIFSQPVIDALLRGLEVFG